MATREQPRAVEADARDLAAEVRVALVELAEDHDEGACFVLTRAGTFRAKANPDDPMDFRLCSDDALIPMAEYSIPQWDHQARILRVGGRIVKRFKRPSPNQEIVLMAFEEEGWPRRIDDPLSPNGEIDPKRRLHDTIKGLNRHQENQLLHFSGDGRGEGVCWVVLVAETLPTFTDDRSRLRVAG